MKFDTVISQLRSLATYFGGRVAGAAVYAEAVNTESWLALPAAYVLPYAEDAGPNELQTGLNQVVTEEIAIVVVLDNTADLRGQTAADQLDTVRSSLFSAILNWRPDWSPSDWPAVVREARGFFYSGAENISMDRARLFWRFRFSLDITISDEDGWQQTFPGLTGVNIKADLAAPYDATATYPAPTAPVYTPAAAPRTVGPDGRVEGSVKIDLP